MATDSQNLKIARVPGSVDSTLASTVLAAGSIVFQESSKRVVVGDGTTAGGVKMVNTTDLNTALATKVNTTDLNTALAELIVEFGGTVPTD